MCGMDRPSPKTLIMIQVDPTKSHRAVEALRIALGLVSHNEGQDITIVLCGRSLNLLQTHPLPLSSCRQGTPYRCCDSAQCTVSRRILQHKKRTLLHMSNFWG